MEKTLNSLPPGDVPAPAAADAASTVGRTGLLLTGGGARAAYQVGVLDVIQRKGFMDVRRQFATGE